MSEITIERSVGFILKENGRVDYHCVVLGVKPSGLDHAGVVAWAEGLGGEAADKREIRLVQANAPDLLPTRGWCWLKDEEGSPYAWICYFTDGYICCYDRSAKGGAVAVKRIYVKD